MRSVLGRPKGAVDKYWPERIVLLLGTIRSIQEERHTVSLRELEKDCGVSRQTISNWLKIAEELGYVNLHNGQPRALELLPEGRRLIKRLPVHDVGRWREMREELRRDYDLRRGNAALRRVGQGG